MSIKNFMNILKGLSSPDKIQAVNLILAKYREQNAVDKNFYKTKEKTQKFRNQMFEIIDASDMFLEALIHIESSSAYSIFSYLLQENVSDILIHKDGIIFSDSNVLERHEIPEDLRAIYNIMVGHFIQNIIFITGQKFDTGNSILDAEVGKLRFNLIHQSLTINSFPVIVIRKATINKELVLDQEKYLSSLGINQRQIDVINKYAYSGNCIIFGEPGSGKTTLLKYMGNYRLKEKRNLCTIEDTKELNIDVPIALVTNRHKNIRDLFIASLRQNPSHVIIGETRTSEIVDILESGLTISVSTTIHANSFRRAVERIVFMSAERNISPENIRNLINSAVDCFIFMEKRKVKEIWEHTGDVSKGVYESYRLVQ